MPNKKCAKLFHVGGPIVIYKGYYSSLECRLSVQGGSREQKCQQKAQRTVLLRDQNFYFVENACSFASDQI